MSGQNVEDRLKHLEARVDELTAELRAAKRFAKDWRRTVGAFTDDAGMQQILHDAMRLREADRRKTRPKSPRRKPNR